MAKRLGILLFAFGFCSLAVSLVPAGPASAEVNVNVNIGPPAVVVHEPPEMVVVPRTMVYFAPGVSVDLLFHGGFWWTPKEGRWFRAKAYNGPWVVVDPRRVPVEIVRLPRDYRTVYVREKHIPYGHLKKHWREREIEKRSRRGEWREERREHRKEHREDHKERGKGKGHGRND